ncbi:MAG: hypothetical protein P8J27_02240 [Mariniblastus sp.]|nr:hypothetical protein [Mariniblastus sp.]
MFEKSLVLFLLFAFGLCVSSNAQTTKQKTSAADRISRVTNKMQKQQRYKLVYKLEKGEEIQFTTEQSVATKFQMAGALEESSSRSASTKTWKVINIDQLGNITFSLTLDDINMWQKTQPLPVDPEATPIEPVSYNSRTDKTVPDEYKVVAQSIGKTLAVFSVAPHGKVLNRTSNLRESNFGVGKVTIPLPEQAIPVGHTWNVPTILEATDEHGKNLQLKARVRYELARVKGQTAYIRFKTEILTPITSEKVRSTVMQKMTKGEIAFDIEKGRPLLKQVRWNEKAQGFEGPDSFLEYVGKMTEKLVITPGSTAKNAGLLAPIDGEVAKKPVDIKTRDGKPIMRK